MREPFGAPLKTRGVGLVAAALCALSTGAFAEPLRSQPNEAVLASFDIVETTIVTRGDTAVFTPVGLESRRWGTRQWPSGSGRPYAPSASGSRRPSASGSRLGGSAAERA